MFEFPIRRYCGQVHGAVTINHALLCYRDVFGVAYFTTGYNQANIQSSESTSIYHNLESLIHKPTL